MKKRPIVIDCDPGVDDALAIMLAASTKTLDIRAINPVAGNVPYAKTSENARRLAGLVAPYCRLGRGADRPLIRPARDAGLIHGSNGMGGVLLPDTDKTFDDAYAWDILYEEACRFPGELELIVTGPMTNVAIALRCHPDLKDKLKSITAMAGTALSGNANNYAEFNVWVDPHAFEIVLQSGAPLSLCGLEGNNTAAMVTEEIERIFDEPSAITAYTSAIAHFIHDRNTKQWNLDVSNINDLCTMACLIEPEIATYISTHVRCVLSGDAIGQLVFCEPGGKLTANVRWLRQVNKDRFLQMLQDMMACY